MSEQPPAGPPPYQPPHQPPYPPPPGWGQAPPPPPGWGQPPPPPGWGPPPMGPPGPPYGAPPGKPRRTGLVIAIVAAVLVIAAAIVVPVVLLGGDDEPEDAGTDRPTAPLTSDTATSPGSDESTGPASTDLSEVRSFEGLDPTHVPLGDPVTYESSPPAGGNHWSEWLDCGVYDAPVENENAVHDLEHGAVWITYDPALDDADVAALAAQLPQNGIMSPYPDLPAPVVITVWEKQLYLTGADDPRIPLFVEEYDDGVTAPEPFASCAGGTARARTTA